MFQSPLFETEKSNVSTRDFPYNWSLEIVSAYLFSALNERCMFWGLSPDAFVDGRLEYVDLNEWEV